MNFKKILLALSLGTGVFFFPEEGLSTGHPVGELAETPLGTYGGGRKFREIDISEPVSIPAPPVKDQDPLGTCVFFAATGLYETHNPGTRMSESEFAVYAEATIGDCKAGINMGRSLQLAHRDGLIPQANELSYAEAYVPYAAALNGIDTRVNGWWEDLRDLKVARICSLYRGDPKRIYDVAMQSMDSSLRLPGSSGKTSYRLGKPLPLYHVSREARSMAREGYRMRQQFSIGDARAPNLHQVKLALAHGCPVAVAADVYENCWSPRKRNGYLIDLPKQGDEREGSHAFMLTGYDGEYFKVRNSWGMDWGLDGYALISSQYLRSYATEIVAVGK